MMSPLFWEGVFVWWRDVEDLIEKLKSAAYVVISQLGQINKVKLKPH